MGRSPSLRSLAAHVQPVYAGEHQVENHQVGPLGAGELQRLFAIARDDGLMPGLGQVIGQHVHDGLFVVHDQDFAHG